MSNQFYKFISSLIADYFTDNLPNEGDRYYLILNDLEDVKILMASMKEAVSTTAFTYPLEGGGEYTTRQISFENGVGLVVASVGESVTNDFLVTLRNRAGDQEGPWRKKALLSIITSDLDSISGGSTSLQSEGMPLHPSALSKRLNHQIPEAMLDPTDQIVLKNYIEQIDEEHMIQFTTFYDYKEVIEILEKGYLSNEDYQNLGLFRDEQLKTYKGANLQRRLEKNKDLYSTLKNLNELNQDDSEFERYFMEKDLPKLKKDNWRGLDFNVVLNSNEKRKESNKSTKVEFEKVTFPSKENYSFNIRSLSDKGAGKRKHQVLIYSDGSEPVSFKININVSNSEKDGLQKEFLTVRGNSDVKVRKRLLEVKIEGTKDKATFERIVYKHEKKASLGAEFNICVLPYKEPIFEHFHNSFIVNYDHQLLKLPFDADEFILGSISDNRQELTIKEDQEKIILDDPEEKQINISEQLLDYMERLIFDIKYNGSIVKIELAGEKPEITPIQANRLAKLKREQQTTFDLSDKLVTSNEGQKFYVHQEYKGFLDIEKDWLNELASSGYFTGGQFDKEEEIKLPVELKNAYNRFINSFLKHPASLTYWNSNISDRATEYVEEYIKAIKDIDDTKPAGLKSKSLFKLGVIYNDTGNEIWLSPFHPLNVAFELRKQDKLSTEEIDTNILDRLRPDGLLPYIYNERDEIYTPDTQQNMPGWVVYKKVDTANVMDADLYLNKVIKDKLDQFEEHFSYLFLNDSAASIKINFINILNDYQAIRGIIQWYLANKIKKGNGKTPPLRVNIYRSQKDESFCEHFTEINSVEWFETKFNLKLKPENENQTPQDLLEELHKNIEFFVTDQFKEYDYAHISFYKMEAQKQFASQPMAQLEAGVSMDGLYNSVPSKKFEEDYRSGFGVKDYQVSDHDLLLQCAYYSNELASNIVNQASNTYVKNRGIVSRTTLDDVNNIKKILHSSNWVTFVDPGVELDFFEETIDDLLVIHYNDQYSSSSRYDAVTVTNRSNQYFDVIKEFFDSFSIDVKHDSQAVERTISAFNSINGEWLLKVIGSRGYFTEEKLSIIAAIKISLAYFNYPDITWVPVSLEEVLRVAGAVSLDKSSGIFTARNLGVKGKHSDDVLLIGLEKSDSIKIHLYPIEVKIGNNDSGVIKKAKEQISRTRDLLMRETIENENSFMKEFYKNFFVQLFISNAKRMVQTNFWPSKDYNLSDELTEQLKKRDYSFVNDLGSYIGKGAVVSYKKGVYASSNKFEDDTLVIEMSKEDYLKACLTKEVDELEDSMISGNTDFVKENILKYNYGSPTESNVDTASEIIRYLTE